MAFKVGAILIILVSLVAVSLGVHPFSWAAFGERITISNNQFYAGSTRIWINGANTPWNNWNDFGGNFNYSWWDSHFQELHNNGINATRIWITCDGEVGINIDSNGYVSGATQAHWNDLESLFNIAQNRQVYIMATLMSFDHFGTNHKNYQRWRDWLNSDSNIDSYVNNYLIPFVNRYKNNPWLWSIDLINEPDWVYSAEGGYTSWDRLQMYFAKASKAIHENSSILLTVGMAMPKYSSDSCSGCLGNKVSDSALQAKVNDPDVHLNFWQTHYYPWQDPHWGLPFYTTPASYGLESSKPALVGECPATGSTGNTTTQDYEQASQKGWQGVMAWTSNGVDSNGSLTDLGPATGAFRDNHYSLVFPCSTPGTPSSPSPSNGTTGVSINPTLSWASSANTDSYDVYFGTSSSPPYVTNTTSAIYNPATLSSNTTYYWKIVAKNNCGGSTTGPIWSFTAVNPNVSVTLTPQSTTVRLGGTLKFNAAATNNSSSSITFQCWAYLTLPNGNRYPPIGELVGPTTLTLSAGQTKSGLLSLKIPKTAPLGTYTYHGNVGPYPTVWDSDSFLFTVTSIPAPQGESQDGWEHGEIILNK